MPLPSRPAILELVETPRLAARLGAAARARALAEFGMDRMLERVEALYRRPWRPATARVWARAAMSAAMSAQRVVLAGFYPPPFAGEPIHVKQLAGFLRDRGLDGRDPQPEPPCAPEHRVPARLDALDADLDALHALRPADRSCTSIRTGTTGRAG